MDKVILNKDNCLVPTKIRTVNKQKEIANNPCMLHSREHLNVVWHRLTVGYRAPRHFWGGQIEMGEKDMQLHIAVLYKMFFLPSNSLFSIFILNSKPTYSALYFYD